MVIIMLQMQVMINLCLTILEKNRRNENKIFSRKCNSIMNNANYQEARVKLSNTQLNKLNNKNLQQKIRLPHQLFLATRQTTKIRNAIAKNMSTDIKLSNAQLSKMIQSGGFLRNMFGNLGEKVISDLLSL